MPRPMYVICAQSGAEDKRTNLVSLFNIVERFEAVPLPTTNPAIIQSPTLYILAVWVQGETDQPDNDFEHQFVFSWPEQEPILTEPMRFRFEKPLYRFMAINPGPLFFRGTGTFRIESKVRLVGTEEWLRQEYLVAVEMKNPE